MNNRTNGRVDIINSCFSHSDRIPVKQEISYREALNGTWNESKLSLLFFSLENQKIIQNGIRAGVYQRSKNNFIIDEQNYDELKIIMRSIFLQNSVNDNKNITRQIEELNQLVLDYAIHQVYGEAESYIQYKYDSSTLVVPMSTPIMSKENKQLTHKSVF